MSHQVPTVKVVRNGQVFVINMTDFDSERDELAKGDELPPLPPLDPSQKEMLFGSSKQPSTWTLPDGTVLQLGTVVAEAHKRSGMSVEEWNSQPQDAIEDRIAEIVAEMVPAPVPFKVAKRGSGTATKFFIMSSEGTQVGTDEFATEAEALAKLEELKAA